MRNLKEYMDVSQAYTRTYTQTCLCVYTHMCVFIASAQLIVGTHKYLWMKQLRSIQKCYSGSLTILQTWFCGGGSLKR